MQIWQLVFFTILLGVTVWACTVNFLLVMGKLVLTNKAVALSVQYLSVILPLASGVMLGKLLTALA